MLSKIRERIQGILAIFIVSLLAIPFVLWGIGSYFEGGADAPVATVNGIEISQREYRRMLDDLRSVNPRAVENPALRRTVLDNLIDQTLLTAHAYDSGYRMSDVQLARLIHEIPYFQKDGRFDPDQYQSLLRSQGLRASDFEAQLRLDNAPIQVRRGLSESAFVTEAELDAVVRLLRQERRFSHALIDPDAFLPKITVSAAEIEEYYRANQESFRSPEAVRVAHVRLRAADIAQRVQTTEEELRQAYEAESARYTTPERRTVSHILIELPADANDAAARAARARAEDLLKQARAGADFAALAKKHSDDAESAPRGGDLGNVARGVLPAELEAAVYALKPGEVSEPVRTSYGLHLAKLTGYTPEQRRAYAAVKQELADEVRRRKGELEFYELAERFRNLVYEHPESLEPAAEALDLEVQTSDWFTRAGGTGIAAQPSVASAAFEPEVLSRERNSDAIEVDGETLVALHVLEHRPAAVRPLAEVRASIERTLKAQRAREQARALADGWIEELARGQALEELARGPGVTLQASRTLTRAQAGGVDQRLVNAVFAAPRPQDQPVAGQVDLGARGHAVYALEAVRAADPKTADAALTEKVKQQLLQRHGADHYAGHRAGLRETASIEINADQL